MKSNWKYAGITAAIFGISGFFTNLAFADGCDLFSSGGFLANVVECTAPPAAPAAKAADQLNGQLGRPVDHVISAGMNGAVPGSGTVLEGAWAVQNSGILPPARPMTVPMQSAPPPAIRFGNMCATQVGIFGPGMARPVGASCVAITPIGQVPGQIY